MKKLKILTKITLPIYLSVLLGGCAYEQEKIALAYQPMQLESIPSSEEGRLFLEIRDQRRIKGHVGKKIGSHGEQASEIKLERHLKEEIKDALETELKQKGFSLDEKPSSQDVKVKIAIQKFLNEFEPGKWLAKAGAELVMDVSVFADDGKQVFEKTITGEGSHEKIWAFSGKNAKIPLDEAFNDAIHKLISDPEFLGAISKKESTTL